MNKTEIVANSQLLGRFSIKALPRTIRSLHYIPSSQINCLPVRDTEFLSWKMILGSWDDGLLLVCLLHKIFGTLPSPPHHYLYQSFFSFFSFPFRNLFPFSCPGITNLQNIEVITNFIIFDLPHIVESWRQHQDCRQRTTPSPSKTTRHTPGEAANRKSVLEV